MTTTFTINADNAEASIGAGAQAFASEKEFGKVTAEWPISRFVEDLERLRRHARLRHEAG